MCDRALIEHICAASPDRERRSRAKPTDNTHTYTQKAHAPCRIAGCPMSDDDARPHVRMCMTCTNMSTLMLDPGYARTLTKSGDRAINARLKDV